MKGHMYAKGAPVDLIFRLDMNVIEILRKINGNDHGKAYITPGDS